MIICNVSFPCNYITQEGDWTTLHPFAQDQPHDLCNSRIQNESLARQGLQLISGSSDAIWVYCVKKYRILNPNK